MPGGMAPLKKPRNPTKLPLALNPTKSKDVLAVLAERNQAIIPVGAWVEPASPNCTEIPAHASAYMIEEEIKEQQRRKQESLKHFQRQVQHRVNQQVKLRKKQLLQKSYKAAEKEGYIAMQCSDPTHLTPKRTSVFPSNLNAAIGSCRFPPSQVLGDATEDGENQNQLFKQQAHALSQTLKQARQQLASFKTVGDKKTPVFLNGRRKDSPAHELTCIHVCVKQKLLIEKNYNKALLSKPACIKINKEAGEEPLGKIHEGPLTTIHYQNFMENQDLGCGEISSVVTGEKEKEDWCVGYQQDLLSEDREKAVSKVQKVKFKNPLFFVIKEDEQKQLNINSLQAVLPQAQDYFVEVQGNCPESQSGVIDVLNVEPKASSIEPKTPGVEPNTQATGIEFKTSEPEGQALTTASQDIVKAQTVELDENIELEAHDFLPPNQTFSSRDRDFLPKCQDQDSLPKDHHVLSKYWNVLPKRQDQHSLPVDQEFLPRKQLALSEEQSHPLECQIQDLPPKEESFLPRHQYNLPMYQDRRGPHVLPKCQDHDVLSKDQSNLHKCQEQDLPLENQQVYEEYRSGLSKYHASLAFQSGVDQEEDKKERQKQYLRHRRLFMDIEREQVKEQNRQREQKKRIEKIKRRKEQQRHAEEQRLLRAHCREEPCSEQKISDVLAQLQLEGMKGAREKHHQREKEYVRYVEALRAQVQEKMKLYNITLPPLCCCGPDFWDAHPDTCANNCIFYKNYRAYNRALHSVINSSDISEGNVTLRNAIRNFASVHRRTSKKSLQ
ncbi:coiled-coil domain-containing protein 15 isoform X9 [Alexandromys fortis]|uniref:coiled-coil domain-containing protein 15 isoform X9 n=1 Tax=Alexandromys fortis TaxID=100897 RepID=UPI0021530FD7|nr:coiled-coil domain-containing protein 15 isoform X9 [Microtus fortis]